MKQFSSTHFFRKPVRFFCENCIFPPRDEKHSSIKDATTAVVSKKILGPQCCHFTRTEHPFYKSRWCTFCFSLPRVKKIRISMKKTTMSYFGKNGLMSRLMWPLCICHSFEKYGCVLPAVLTMRTEIYRRKWRVRVCFFFSILPAVVTMSSEIYRRKWRPWSWFRWPRLFWRGHTGVDVSIFCFCFVVVVVVVVDVDFVVSRRNVVSPQTFS